MRSTFFTAAAALVASSLVQAQTFTDCNPLEKTCPTEEALGTSIEIDFTKGKTNHFFELDGTNLKYGPEGAEFIITKNEAPTIESHWNILFGRFEVTMKAAHGRGIVSSLVLESSTLDEVDWEWIGSDYDSVQTNYYGKGNTTTYDRAIYHPHPNSQEGFHTYAMEWTTDYLKWFIDGREIRHLAYSEAVGGKNFPQTPMKVKLGNWIGGGPNSPEGTVQWAGGLVELDQGPFTMIVKNIKVTDGNPGAKSYTYTDNSGSWQSIKVEGGDGAQFNEESSSSSSVEPTSTKTSTKASSTETSTEEETSTLLTSTSTSTSTSAEPTITPPSNGTTTVEPSVSTTDDADAEETSGPAQVPEDSGAGSIGANFALVIAAGALSYIAL